jgi:hypothetical protein
LIISAATACQRTFSRDDQARRRTLVLGGDPVMSAQPPPVHDRLHFVRSTVRDPQVITTGRPAIKREPQVSS